MIVDFHRLRRTNLSYTAANGGLDLARQQAGHADARTTERHYLDPRIVRRQSAVDVLPTIRDDGNRSARQLRLF